MPSRREQMLAKKEKKAAKAKAAKKAEEKETNAVEKSLSPCPTHINYVGANTLKVKQLVAFQDRPVRILTISKSAPGKHGGAKLRIDVKDVFNGRRFNEIVGAHDMVEVPDMERIKATLIRAEPMQEESSKQSDTESQQEEQIMEELDASEAHRYLCETLDQEKIQFYVNAPVKSNRTLAENILEAVEDAKTIVLVDVMRTMGIEEVIEFHTETR